MKIRKTTTIALVCILIAVAACTSKVKTAPGKTPQPVLDNIAVQLGQLKDGARATREVKELLLSEGKITKATSNTITKALIKIDSVAQEMNRKLATYDTFTPTAKADLLKLFNDLINAYQDLTANGTFKANAGVSNALVILDAALAALKIYLQ